MSNLASKQRDTLHAPSHGHPNWGISLVAPTHSIMPATRPSCHISPATSRDNQSLQTSPKMASAMQYQPTVVLLAAFLLLASPMMMRGAAAASSGNCGEAGVQAGGAVKHCSGTVLRNQVDRYLV
jgi:hypothetical protein